MSESVNPNVNIGAAGAETADAPVKTGPIKAGTGSLDFDALEGLLSPKQQKQSAKIEKAIEKAVSTKADQTSEVTEIKTETTSEAKPAVVETAKPTSETAPTTTKEEAPTTAAEAAKKLSLKVGPRGREVELDVDTKIPVKIDGKDEEITLEDLRKNFSGKVAYDKRFSELDNRDKAYQKDKEQTEKQLNSILTKAYNKDVLGAILEIVDIAKLDPTPIFEGVRDNLIGDLNTFVSMTPEQRDAHWLKKENEFLRQYKASADKVVTSRQADEALTKKLTDLRDTLKVSDEWITKAQNEIKSNPEAYKNVASKPEGTIELADAMKRWDTAQRVLSKVDPDFGKDPDMIEIAARKLQGHPEVDEEKAAQIVLKALKLDQKTKDKEEEQKAAETLTKKVEAGAPLKNNSTYNPTADRKRAREIASDNFDPRGWGKL